MLTSGGVARTATAGTLRLLEYGQRGQTEIAGGGFAAEAVGKRHGRTRQAGGPGARLLPGAAPPDGDRPARGPGHPRSARAESHGIGPARGVRPAGVPPSGLRRLASADRL